MAKVLVHIWHKPNGEIAAIGRPMARTTCVPFAGENQFVFETEVDEESVATLHRTHVVDARQRALVAYGRS